MPRYRKIPVEVDALRWTGSNCSSIASFMAGGKFTLGDDGTLTIHTLEGDMLAKQDDWIVRGVEGEYYPVNPAIFRKTYERVEEENTPMPRDDTI